MVSVRPKVSGNIISELSDKIHSYIIALNELTKNSYDAFANEVNIDLDIINKKLIIKDDGCGMNNQTIKKLFHISSSEKKYGKIIHNKERNLKRYTQGSKGLGFLSVFKLGNNITWETNNSNKKIKFTVNKNELVSRNDVSSYRLTTEEEPSNEKGTTIFIELEKESADQLEDYFAQEKNIKKIINAFDDKQFKINLKTNHGSYESERHSNFKNFAPNDQLFYITYSSKKSGIDFFYMGNLIKTVPYNINIDAYELEIELIAFSFSSYGKKNISQLFYREHDDALTPLIYINNNLFHNYTLFDASRFRQKRSGESLPQLIGYIRIISSHSLMEFNSDRTQFVQNNLTLHIEKKLKELNEIIQNAGSEIKKSLKDQDGKLITGAAYPQNKQKSLSKKSVENGSHLQPAQLNLKQKIKKLYIPSKQIDLIKELTSAINSKGELIDLNKDIQIEVDNEKILNSILESQEKACEKKISYIYNDCETGKVVQTLILKFELPEAQITAKGKNVLFHLPSTKDYSIKIPYVANLILQLEKLHKQKGNYNEIIACALRSIFELSSDYLQNQKRNIFPKSDSRFSFEDSVEYIISYIQSNKHLKTEISEITGISFKTLTNLLQPPDSFSDMIKKAHLGAHKSMAFLTDSEVKDLAKKAGIFAILSDVLLYNVDDDIISKCKKPE
ncbi:ATP-binding protein [Frischella perrara]|uniref:ATP-binding protein n=1 Tax=Frischella perrara TaxID=1267021 RepID=UPI0023F00B50|nr:ATP-binding protein [Frischella perrara]